MWITRTAIDHPVFATMVMVALTVLGLFSYQRLGVEAMPDIRLPFIAIAVDYPGASPEQAENDVARPIENALNTVAGIKVIRSLSREGQNLTFVEFRLDTDVGRATQDVRDRVAQIRAGFPREVKDPVIERDDEENDQPVAIFALTAATRATSATAATAGTAALGARELSVLAEQVVAKGLQRAAGVGRVALDGSVTRQIQVQVDPLRLTAYGLTVDQVVSAVRAANISVPVGTVANATGEAIVRVDGRTADPADLGRIIVARRNGNAIWLDQVARVVDGERERDSIARVDGREAVGLLAYRSQDANIVATGQAIKAAAERIRAQLPAGVELRLLRLNSDDVERAVANVKHTILEGAALTVLIVFLFLGSWRSTVITGLTLPIAVIATFVALDRFGFTLNSMTLMALSLCIGLLIDDAIVVRENIVRHLRMGKDHRSAARDGTEEIGLAVLATTLSIVAVFVPIAFMHGIIGKFFYPFGITVAVAVLLSLFVSFTLDPMLSALWHDPPGGVRDAALIGPLLRRFEALLERLHRIYGRLLAWALAHRPHTLALALASFCAALPLAGVVGTEMLPATDDAFTSVRLTLPVGSSLAYADARVRQVEARVREFAEVTTIDTLIGTDGSHNTARLNLTLVPRASRTRSQKDLESAIRQRVASVPGVELQVGFDRPIWINVLGNDLAAMQAVTAGLRSRISAVPGITDLEVSLKDGTPALSIRLKPELAAEYGITHAQLGSTLRAMIGGQNSGYWLAPDGQNYEIVTQLPRAERMIADDVANLNIATGRALADGSPEVAPLRAIAAVESVFNPQNVRRQDLQRRVALFAGVEGRPSGDVGKEVKALVDAYPVPQGMRIEINGEIEQQQEINAALIGALLLAVIFIYLVLASQFGSFLQPVAIMASLPLAIVGVMLALVATHTTLNIFSMIGVVFLMGLVTKNAILLVDFANHGRRRGLDCGQALLAAGQVRLRPILMTTAAMLFGMLPLALGLGAGAEQQAPMGRAIIGGVITSTVLTLVVVPVIYSYIDGLRSGLLQRRVRHGGGVRAAQPADRA